MADNSLAVSLDLGKLTIQDFMREFKAGKVSSKALTENFLALYNQDRESELPLNAFLEIYDDAVSLAEKADEERRQAEVAGTLDKLFEEKPLLSRLALHAYAITITHPVSQERITFTAPYPKDLESVRKQFSKIYGTDPLAPQESPVL